MINGRELLRDEIKKIWPQSKPKNGTRNVCIFRPPPLSTPSVSIWVWGVGLYQNRTQNYLNWNRKIFTLNMTSPQADVAMRCAAN
jgi:hypothetical protein